MSILRTKKGYMIWGSRKGLSPKEVEFLIKEYEKDTGEKLYSHKSYYGNQYDQIEKSRKRFHRFCNWCFKK